MRYNAQRDHDYASNYVAVKLIICCVMPAHSPVGAKIYVLWQVF